MTVKKHILVVEDDISLAEWISDYLLDHGYEVTVASQGDYALEMIADEVPDLVLLDVMIPVKNGFDVCKEAREFYSGPILFMTACVEDGDEIQGLEMGADDYLTKPFHPEELLARIKALIRRAAGKASSLITNGPFSVNISSLEVKKADEFISLSSSEYKLFEFLMLHPGEVQSKSVLTEHIYDQDFDLDSNVIEVFIRRLRKKLDPDNHYQLIETLRGQGYRLKPLAALEVDLDSKPER